MTSTLYVVGAPEPSRATRIDALTVDRSKYLGGQGAVLEKRLTPLEPDEQAMKDRCDEKVKAAKADESLSLYQVRQRIAQGSHA